MGNDNSNLFSILPAFDFYYIHFITIAKRRIEIGDLEDTNERSSLDSPPLTFKRTTRAMVTSRATPAPSSTQTKVLSCFC